MTEEDINRIIKRYTSESQFLISQAYGDGGTSTLSLPNRLKRWINGTSTSNPRADERLRIGSVLYRSFRSGLARDLSTAREARRARCRTHIKASCARKPTDRPSRTRS
jgi:hypothetical protein